MAAEQITVVMDVIAKMDKAEAGFKKLQGTLQKFKLPDNLDNGFKKSFANIESLFAKYRSQLEKGFETKGDVSGFIKTSKAIDTELDRLSKHFTELTGKQIDFKIKTDEVKRAEKDITDLAVAKEKFGKETLQLKVDGIKKEELSSVKKALEELQRITKGNTGKAAGNILEGLDTGNIQQVKKGMDDLLNSFKNVKSEAKLLDIKKAFGLDITDVVTKIINALRGVEGEMDNLNQKSKTATDNLQQVKLDQMNNVGKKIGEAANEFEHLRGETQKTTAATQEYARATQTMSQQLGDLQQSTQYFFSLRNMINLLKRGIDEAVQSVKDLDKAMTETAVVTDYKVSDLWGMLPEYTKVANDLGATTQGAYETMTLYYQQGLEQQQAFELGAETMKMARIAGLDYAETTDMMTAALRGFNMELNEVSAKRVNDVYSELAAITASDTEELGTAMQRTASIAASAGASFEGTTAFLAQAIETTREPAENIGTAMKTIVARFQELKKNPLEISEVEGEEVDYNKIDTALKTIGVDLKDANGQFRDFDEVMLDISARWDSLSQAQQRYIATTAAGSRQQSRFIAMVSNYDRTMQLMEAANNSAGASDEQFGKTMDSLESKLNKLHNAWQQFTMGIANNGMIKLAVDGLTGFLNVTNKIIDTLSLGSGVFKSFLSVFAAFTGLKIAGRAANSLIGGLGGLIDPTSTFKQGFKTGAIRQPNNQAKAISDPIVQAINRIYGVITGKSATQNTQNTTADFKAFKKANSDIREFLGGVADNKSFSITEAYGKISNLDTRQQKAILQQLPGLQLSLKENGISFDTAGLKGETAKLVNSFKDEINQGLKENTIDAQTAMQIFGTPENLKRAMGARGPEYAKAASEIFFNQEEYDKTYKETFQNLLTSDDAAYLSDEQMHKAAHDAAVVAAEAKATEEYQKRITSKASAGMRVANDFAEVGQAAMMAGQGVAQFGMQLSNIGFTEAGQAITNLGYQISSLGSIAANAGTLVGKILDKGGIFGKTGLMAAHPAITALIVAVTALGTVFAAASAEVKKIKEAGEEVTKTFNETNKSVEDNIAKLKSYQSEFATLSKGVDSNGNNVSLDDSQYQRYLEIVDDIAAINPEIVDGYNAQGHAIINNNKALTETLKKQQEIRKEAYSTYTSEDSLKALIRARNVNKDYYESVTNKTKAKGTFVGGTAGQVATDYTSPMTGDVASIADKLGLIKDFDETVLEKYGIDSLEALESGEEKAVKNFIKHRQQIEAELSGSDLKLDDAVLKGFDKLGEDTAAFDEAIKPVYDNLLANVSNSAVFDSIAPEFREALNMGLKDLASQDLSASDMSRAATTMATKFANLTTGSGKYQEAMDKVADAQEKFATNLEETEYKANVQPAIDDLVRLKEEALKEGGAYGDALAEYLDNQIEQIASFTEQGTTTIQEGLNTATDAIAQAESALDNFNEATKKDFSTAAEGMRSIYDKIFETYKDSYGNELEKHTEGEGDNTFWTGAEALLSEDKLTGGVKEVTKSLKELEPWLREGKEGMDAFFTDVVNNENLKKLEKDGLISLDKNGWFKEIPEDQWNAVADALGISEDLLTSMLNKARQFGLIEFDNLEKVREALATSDSAITGIESNAQGQKALYVKEDTMRQNLREAGYNTKESQDKVIERLLKEQNVNMVKTMENINKDEAKALTEAWGIKDLPDLITKMSETGDYNRDEILDLAEKAGLGSGEAAADVYDKVISALDNPELAAQTSELQSINAKLDAIVEKETGKGVEDHEAAQKEAHEASLGENGIATNFAKGLDAEGKVLDTGSFAVVRDELEKTQAQYEESAAYYRERAEIADDADKKRFNNLANLYEADAAAIQKAIKQGEDAKKKLKDNAEDRKTKNKFKRDDKEGKNNGKEPVSNIPVSSNRPLEQTEKKNIETTEKHHKTEEVEKTTKYDSSETAEHKKLQKLWEEDKNNPHLDKDVTVEGDDKGLKDLNKGINKFDARLNTPFMARVQGDTSDANKKVGEFSQYVQKQNPKVPVSANTGSAKSSINSLYNVSTLFVPIKPDFQGNWEKTVRIKKETVPAGRSMTNTPEPVAVGKNNYGYFSAPPSIGSAARGNYGRLGPKGKGGPTLTGELGYEVAWLPSENRSMILGANGPQMIDLPGDAVVWTHEQSKKILKQKAIPIGSQANPYTTGDSSNYTVTYVSTGGGGGGGNDGKKDSKDGKKITTTVNKVSEVIIKTSGKAFSWWEKISRQVKAAEKTADRLGDQVTKVFNDIRASIEDVNQVNKQFIQAQKNTIKLNQTILNKSNKSLQTLDKGTSRDKYRSAKNAKEKADENLKKARANYKKNKNAKNKDALKKAEQAQREAAEKLRKVTPKEVKEAKKEYRNAKKAYQKNKSKKNKKRLDKARKAYQKADEKASKQGINWQTVEWKQTKKITKNGKTTKKKVDKKQKINLSKYIKQDADGNYYVDQKAIDKLGKKDKARAKAIQKAAYEQIDKYQERKDDAQDSITKAQDELADYRKQIDDAFFGWENELTKVYKITSEIEQVEAKIARSRSKYNYGETRLGYIDYSKGSSIMSDLYTILDDMKAANAETVNGLEEEIKLKDKQVKATKEEIEQYNELDEAHAITHETINGEVETLSELELFDKIKDIDPKDLETGWDRLSEQEKDIYTRGIAFQKNDQGQSFIYQDKAGNWTIDSDLIEQTIASGGMNKELGERLHTLFDNLKQNTLDTLSAESELYDLQTDKLQAEHEYSDAVKEVTEELYGWENELTKIYELTQQIEQLSGQTDFFKSGVELYQNQRSAGYATDSSQILVTYTKQINSLVSEINGNISLLPELRQELFDYISGDKDEEKLEQLKEELQTAEGSRRDTLQAEIDSLQETREIRSLLAQYVQFGMNADGTVSMQFDTAAIERDRGTKLNSTRMALLMKGVEKIQSLNKQIQSTQTAINNKMSELYNELTTLRQTYADNAKELREAYSQQQQEIINKIKSLYSAIDNAFKELINQVKQEISLRRQAEDNAKTQSEISRKQQRLAALRANTAGGNQVEIAKLQKEITESQQSYSRTLEDQLMDTLSRQGDEAAKQRDRQIALLQAQRDIAQKTGLDAAKIDEWITNPGKHEQEIREALFSKEGYNALTKPERNVVDAGINDKIANFKEIPGKIAAVQSAIGGAAASVSSSISGLQGALAGLANMINNMVAQEKERQEKIDATTEQLDLKNKSKAELEQALDKAVHDQQTAQKQREEAYQNYQNAQKDFNQKQAKASSDENIMNRLLSGYQNLRTKANKATNSQDRQKYLNQANIIHEDYLRAKDIYSTSRNAALSARSKAASAKSKYNNANQQLSSANNIVTQIRAQLQTVNNTIATLEKDLDDLQNYAYASGGLNTHTGPAWLDGTPSRPELVLDATDTKNFLALRNVLSKAVSSTDSLSNSYTGDVTYEININVDKIEKDYDVDKVIEKVKKEIVKGAGYRNVTQVRNFK